MSTSSPSSSAARRSRTIDVRVSSPATIGYDDDCSSTGVRFASPSAAARFAVTRAAALDAGHPDTTLTITRTPTGHGDDDVCVSGTPGEITCALAATPIYSAGVRTARIPAPEYLRAAVDEVTLPMQWQGSVGVEAGVDVRVLSTRPDPLPNSTLLLGQWAPDLAHRLAQDLARSITERSGRRTPATVTYLPDQGRYEITHPAPISDTDAAAVARYIRITQLRANLAALDPVADADCAVGLAAELRVLESYSRHIPSTDDRTVR
ncbi:methyltransferase [Rhodococcoides yunnanense]|uniref:Methyltransferase n=1 Tax=Rhodococcoides yunnanense TaxID=278209 RepID=A0ABU4BI89_9NOCA|nr:methyltransferase [Rhodococcus yunnanensis]MDV6263895.1 methyltransferase [Rhodococcus yunnanensis]